MAKRMKKSGVSSSAKRQRNTPERAPLRDVTARLDNTFGSFQSVAAKGLKKKQTALSFAEPPLPSLKHTPAPQLAQDPQAADVSKDQAAKAFPDPQAAEAFPDSQDAQASQHPQDSHIHATDVSQTPSANPSTPSISNGSTNALQSDSCKKAIQELVHAEDEHHDREDAPDALQPPSIEPVISRHIFRSATTPSSPLMRLSKEEKDTRLAAFAQRLKTAYIDLHELVVSTNPQSAD